MSKVEKEDHTQAVEFIECFKKKQMDDAVFTVKHGEGWAYEQDAQESAEKMDYVISAILSISLEGQAISEDIENLYLGAIEKKVLDRNGAEEIPPLLHRYKIMNRAITAILSSATEIMDLHHHYDGLTMNLSRYISHLNNKSITTRNERMVNNG